MPRRGHLNPIDALAGTYRRESKSSRCLRWHYVGMYFLCYTTFAMIYYTKYIATREILEYI